MSIDNLWQSIQDNPLIIRDLSDDDCRELVALVAMLNKMVENRDAVLALIPECPEHGAGCLEHASEWIQERAINS
jgi:hypothetical protein